MKQRNIKAKSGFTIIEVVLVLAIAGLIFLMVFVALPALQRSQRDTQRRDDMSRVDTAVNQWQTNNSTKSDNLPSESSCVGEEVKSNVKDISRGKDACKFIRDYMNKSSEGGSDSNTFMDPDGNLYGIVIENGPTGNNKKVIEDDFPNNHRIYIIRAAKCDQEDAVSSDKRDYAILYRLEGSGVSCTDNQ